ncbi:MAG: hypothetical protein ABSG68_12385 [Thermoguttaceae bacterium]|jgi:hypothetical protein
MAQFQVITVWWPDGWEPNDPLDVPNCMWQAGEQTAEEPMSLEQALATVRGLNRQNMAHPGAVWHAVGVVEDGSALSDDCGDSAEQFEDASGRSIRLLRPRGSGKGDCSHCPAHAFPCAAENGEQG